MPPPVSLKYTPRTRYHKNELMNENEPLDLQSFLTLARETGASIEKLERVATAHQQPPSGLDQHNEDPND